MRHRYGVTRQCAILSIMIGLQGAPILLPSSQAQPTQPAGKADKSAAMDSDWEKMKYELEKRRVDVEVQRVELEKDKAVDARTDALWTRISIVIPIVLG